MNLQEIFNRNWQHFVVEGHPRSVGAPGTDQAHRCLYRSPNGSRCAIGCVLPDELYRPELDAFEDEDGKQPDTDIYSVLQRYENIARFFTGILELDLGALQRIHDDFRGSEPAFGAYMADRLKDFAERRDLTVPEPAANP